MGTGDYDPNQITIPHPSPPISVCGPHEDRINALVEMAESMLNVIDCLIKRLEKLEKVTEKRKYNEENMS